MPRDQQHVGCKREQPCQRHLRGRSVVSAGHAGDDRAAEYGVVLIARPTQRAERHESDSHLMHSCSTGRESRSVRLKAFCTQTISVTSNARM